MYYADDNIYITQMLRKANAGHFRGSKGLLMGLWKCLKNLFFFYVKINEK